jgi:3-oxoacyl-[acyl-carrier protein] reductase
MKLKDRVAIVTGAARGIGRAICLALAEEGAIIVGVDVVASEKSEALINEIKAMGGVAEAYQADVRDFEAIEKMAQNVIETYGRIDILVNNAGVNRDALILMMTPEQWREVIEINLYGAFHCTKAVAQQMMFQKSGRIINISSIAGQTPGRGHANYAASKGAVNAFTRAAAVELAPKKVTVNAVAPGVIETEMSAEVMRRAKDQVMEHIPLKRLGRAEDVARMVAFLASDDAAYITGQIFNVDGGFRG